MAATSSPRSPDAALLLLRLGLGVVMLLHGIFKLYHGVEWITGPLSAHGLPGFLAYGTYVAELVAPLLVILGAGTRLAALTIAFDLFGAIVLVRSGGVLSVNQGTGAWGIEVEALIIIVSLAIVLAGPGRFRLIKTSPPWD